MGLVDLVQTDLAVLESLDYGLEFVDAKTHWTCNNDLQIHVQTGI